MNPYKQIELNKNRFTKTDQQIYETLLEQPYAFTVSSVAVTQQFDISQAALTRFAKKVGYKGYNDFKYNLTKYKLSNTDVHISPIDYYKKLIDVTAEKLTDDVFCDLKNDLDQARMIYLTGFQRSMIPAKQLDFNLKEFGYNCQFLSPYEICRLAGYAKTNDVIINFSVFGNTQFDEYKEATEVIKLPRFILITSNPKGKLVEFANKTILLPTSDTERFPVNIDVQFASLLFVFLLNQYLNNVKDK